jgi:hypothetical protein
VIGHEIEDITGEELVRVVRALGKHRYVAARLHLVHAFAVEAAAAATADPALDEAAGWARRVTGSGVVDLASKDERLYRRASDAELVGVLDAFWAAGERSEVARAHLARRLEEIDVDVAREQDAAPFDEGREDDVFPVLVDAGWELIPMTSFDPERHRGAIDAFGDALSFESARFEEESAIPALVTLHELPALGATELLSALDGEGRTRAPFVLWAEGNETYLDSVLRGVLRAAKLRSSSPEQG